MNTVHAFSNGQPIMTQPLLPLIQELPEAGRATVGTSFPIAARGKFIKQFTGPDADSGVVCFKFWQLVHASGCPYQCAYCFLQTTTFFRFNKEALMGLIYSNWKLMITEVEEWLTSPVPRMLIVGELQDGLAFDSAYAGVTGKPLTHHLIPLFASQNRHRLIFLTKSTLTRNALKLPPTAPGGFLVVRQRRVRGTPLGIGDAPSQPSFRGCKQNATCRMADSFQTRSDDPLRC